MAQSELSYDRRGGVEPALCRRIAAIEMAEAIVYDKKKIMAVCAKLDGEYGIKDLYFGTPAIIGAGGLTWQDKMRSYWRYWDGSADVGLNYQQATVDTLGFLSIDGLYRAVGEPGRANSRQSSPRPKLSNRSCQC